MDVVRFIPNKRVAHSCDLSHLNTYTYDFRCSRKKVSHTNEQADRKQQGVEEEGGKKKTVDCNLYTHFRGSGWEDFFGGGLENGMEVTARSLFGLDNRFGLERRGLFLSRSGDPPRGVLGWSI